MFAGFNFISLFREFAISFLFIATKSRSIKLRTVFAVAQIAEWKKFCYFHVTLNLIGATEVGSFSSELRLREVEIWKISPILRTARINIVEMFLNYVSWIRKGAIKHLVFRQCTDRWWLVLQTHLFSPTWHPRVLSDP